jgi:hypothetical protein
MTTNDTKFSPETLKTLRNINVPGHKGSGSDVENAQNSLKTFVKPAFLGKQKTPMCQNLITPKED